MSSLHVHLVSDSTGETVLSVARACLSQFKDIQVVEHLWSLTRTETQIVRVINSVMQKPGVVLYTIIDTQLAHLFKTACASHAISAIPVLESTMSVLTELLGSDILGMPGRQHKIDNGYFDRIRAMEFAFSHDDGEGLEDIVGADVVLTGVSRTSKSPTCFYLANRGLRAANIPFVRHIPFPRSILQAYETGAILLIGLTKSPEYLVHIRRQRVRDSSSSRFGDYTDLEQIRQEVYDFQNFCRKHSLLIIDVSRRSIEETAATVFRKYEEFCH